ncbi:L-asparaginase [Verticillium alfalfae VaMs.102]|uniref:L-asparaginase n=1 Tax=Verticillium alfalfae (strain VaMs.102 / ATCC MYA-4576 / FGSC 10136) TaxID=526221 RepID=C9SYP1_VERA1|nr:L-asparaginase [Verticillium alfalfae VaMs.102]EEY23906.1 L-asparaginase [Verticillium alfalfae VaMs.102]
MTTRLSTGRLPSALQTATHAVSLLENDPLYNSGHGAVFTRDGTNELEASVMVSRGHKKRAVGVSGVRRVRNPILLARAVLENGEDDLEVAAGRPDVPSAQGHGHLHGDELTATLAARYGLETVAPAYFFTQRRWDEHIEALRREDREGAVAATWSDKAFLPQGTGGSTTVTRSFAGSGTGNGDSFLRIAALHSVVSRAQWKRESSAKALSAIAGPRGELQKSAGDRWGRTGEGQGGIIGIELTVVRGPQGDVLKTRSEVLQDYNCAGMFRAWLDDDGRSHAEVWRGDSAVEAHLESLEEYCRTARGQRRGADERLTPLLCQRHLQGLP